MKNKTGFSLILIMLLFFAFLPNVHASQPGTVGYSGPEEVKRGETVTYNLTMRDGNVFYFMSEEYITEELEYDNSVFEFVSFSSKIEGITAEKSGSYIEMKVLSKAAGPYEEDDIIGTIVFKVLDDATLGNTVLVAPSSSNVGSSKQYKVVNVVTSEPIVVEDIKEVTTNENILKDIDDNAIYIIFGSLLILNVVSLTTVIVLISRNKRK